jgi:glutaredoxin
MDKNSKIIVYSKLNCSFCVKAKNLIKSVGLNYTEKKMEDFKDVNEMFDDIGKQVRSMPQIKIDDILVGGYNQLVEKLTDEGLCNFKGEPK